MDKPAILGGTPIFNELVPIIKPSFYKHGTEKTLNKIKDILDSGMVTNHVHVQELEKSITDYLNAKNVVGVSSCTSGLILTLQLLGIRDKEVVIPSFTFAATAHAAYWNNNKIKFADCNAETLNISIDDLQEKISRDTAAIMPVHIFGNPCEVRALEELAEDYKTKLIFDSAHGFGASYNGIKVGNFGEAEVFSCSPTKLFSTLEGGFITTSDDRLAENLKIARNYGNLPDYDCDIPGLNARMTEINAFLGKEMLMDLDEIVKNRGVYAQLYKKKLGKISGINFQRKTRGSGHCYKDFCIVVNKEEFGVDRNALFEALGRENIMPKKYFYPPLHKVNAYIKDDVFLPNTEYISENVLCLPIYNYMELELIDKVCLAIERIHMFRDEI